MKWHLKGTYVYAMFRVTCAESQLSSHPASDSSCALKPKAALQGQGGMHRWLRKPLPWLKGDSWEALTGWGCPPLIPAALLATSAELSLPHKGLLGARSL